MSRPHARMMESAPWTAASPGATSDSDSSGLPSNAAPGKARSRTTLCLSTSHCTLHFVMTFVHFAGALTSGGTRTFASFPSASCYRAERQAGLIAP